MKRKKNANRPILTTEDIQFLPTVHQIAKGEIMTPGFQSGSLYVYATAEKIIAFDPDHPKDPYVFEVVDGQPTGEGHVLIRHEETNRIVWERSGRYRGTISDFYELLLEVTRNLWQPLSQRVIREVTHLWMWRYRDDYLTAFGKALGTGVVRHSDLNRHVKYEAVMALLEPLYNDSKKRPISDWQERLENLDLPQELPPDWIREAIQGPNGMLATLRICAMHIVARFHYPHGRANVDSLKHQLLRAKPRTRVHFMFRIR